MNNCQGPVNWELALIRSAAPEGAGLASGETRINAAQSLLNAVMPSSCYKQPNQNTRSRSARDRAIVYPPAAIRKGRLRWGCGGPGGFARRADQRTSL